MAYQDETVWVFETKVSSASESYGELRDRAGRVIAPAISMTKAIRLARKAGAYLECV